MKVCKHRIDRMPFISRIDKQGRFPGTFLKTPKPVPHTFQCPYTRRTDGNDPSSVCFCLIQDISRLFAHEIDFFVHHVFFDRFRIHRPEGSKPDMKCYIRNGYTLCP